MAEIWKPLTVEEYREWVNAIMSEASDQLTSWEVDFIASIDGRLSNGNNLSERQAAVLERIYSERTK